MLVMKFGGTSVGSAQRMRQVLSLARRAASDGQAQIVVLSAMSGVTNLLIAGAEKALAHDLKGAAETIDTIIAKHDQAIAELLGTAAHADAARAQLTPCKEELDVLYKGISYLGELSKRSLDAVSGIGEILSSRILAAYAEMEKVPSAWVDARTFMITDDAFGKATPLSEVVETKAQAILQPLIQQQQIVFTQGFIGATVDGVSTTLGRGGSDYSASIIGAALKAREIQIWTDVDGMLSADPRVVPDARLLSEVSFQEASELAYFGAKVLHPLTIKPAVEKNIPVRILNTFNPDNQGTLITASAQASGTIRAVAAKKDITALFLNSPHMLMTHGFLAQVFQVFDRHKVPIDLIATSEVSVALTIDSKDRAEPLLRDLGEFGELQTLDKVAIVSVVGRQFREQSGIAGRVFHALSDINIIVISGGASDININFVVANSDADKAVRQLHCEFFSAPSSSAAIV
jgi:aspartate kinase